MTKTIPMDVPVEVYNRVEELGKAMRITNPTQTGERVNISNMIRITLDFARDEFDLFKVWAFIAEGDEADSREIKSITFQVSSETVKWLEESAQDLGLITKKVRGVPKPNVAGFVRLAMQAPFSIPSVFCTWLINRTASGLKMDTAKFSITALDEKDAVKV